MRGNAPGCRIPISIAALLLLLAAAGQLPAAGQPEPEGDAVQLGPVGLDVEIESTVRERLEAAPGVDEAIAEEIMTAIERDPNVRAEDVNVKVEEGVVALSGIVRAPSARQAAERAAEQTYGVAEVRNDIIVR
jgi:hypothetical protein